MKTKSNKKVIKRVTTGKPERAKKETWEKQHFLPPKYFVFPAKKWRKTNKISGYWMGNEKYLREKGRIETKKHPAFTPLVGNDERKRLQNSIKLVTMKKVSRGHT